MIIYCKKIIFWFMVYMYLFVFLYDDINNNIFIDLYFFDFIYCVL